MGSLLYNVFRVESWFSGGKVKDCMSKEEGEEEEEE